MIVANTVFKDEKNGPDAISALSDVQLGASTMVRRVSAMSENLTEQLDQELVKCRWYRIQCDESVDNTSTAQMMMIIRMTTTRGIDIYNTVKRFFVEKKIINGIRSKAKRHRTFKVLLEELSAEYVLSVGLIFVFECSVSNRSFVVLQHNWTQIFSGETISVRCEIQGGGDTQWEYEWRTTSSHQPVTGPDTAPTHSEYRLGTASVFHSGEYWCKARADWYSSTEWSEAFQLRVTPDKPRPRLTADNTTITGKGSVALSCSVENASEWRYDWFRRTSASSAAQILSYNETDDGISISEEGIYSCRGRRGDTTFLTEDSNRVTIENRVSHKASVALQPDWSLVFSGETITVRCEVPADVPAEWEYEWTKPNSTRVPTHNEYRIVNASSSDSGSYRCLAKDKKNLNSTTEWSDDITLTVSASPGWKYYWFRGEKTSEPLTDEDFKSHGQSASASSEGLYWCRGGRGDPVHYTQYSNSVRIHGIVHNRAAVTLQPNWPNRYRGEAVTLRCEIQGGDSEWEYEWTATSSQAPPNTKEFRISLGSDLSGSYWCQGRLKGARQNSTGWSVPLTLSNAAAPPPVVTVSPSWLTPGASVTLTCGGGPHPTAGWRFYWYRADPISLDQVPRCQQSIPYWWSDVHVPEFSYELLPGSDGGTEQNSFVIQGLTESAGYACRAGRGDPVFYTEYSETKWVWSGVSAAAPPPVVTVSPSWLTPGASGTLTCGGGPHPTAGWRFYWYRADPISLDQVPRCKQSIRYGWSEMHIPEKFSYELLPGSDGGTEQNSFVIQGLTESAGYACRAGRGDPVFYTEYSETTWVWSGDSNSSVSLTLSPDSVQHFYDDVIRLTCKGNSDKWRLWMFTRDKVLMSECKYQERITSFTWKMKYFPSGVFWCGSGSEISNALNISTAAAPPPVVTVSPSWLTPGASVTLTCGGGPHPTAGWRFYWYRADSISLDQVPRCKQSIRYGWSEMHIPEKFGYELLPGSDGGTEQNSFVIQGLTESAGYACRAGRGDPVFYTEYSETKWVWSGVYHDVLLESPARPVTEGQSVTLNCSWLGPNLDSNFTFYKNDELLQSDVRRELEISAVSKSDEGFYKCEHSGSFSRESWMSVKCECDQYEVEKESPG
ncbi:uncharacterized protein LOC132996251 [Limanda limanda]|uniref:uncharacterized protein LOC132996251 n=1 Tax=Limanda limanda TaxID=27771 RepID=UPI0029C7EAC0|nr:uncharacterized protein LOC132996251 [Limanda limanda]